MLRVLINQTQLQGYFTHKKPHPTVGLCLGPYDVPRGVGVFLWARYPCKRQNQTQLQVCVGGRGLDAESADPALFLISEVPLYRLFLMSEVPLYRYALEDANLMHRVLIQRNPKPQTLNPQPFTLNPTPSTLNPQPSTLNPAPCTLHPEP